MWAFGQFTFAPQLTVMKRILYILFFLSVTAYSFGSTPKSGNEDNAYRTFSGKVIDANTKEPLTGALVTIEGTSFTGYTDFDGNFFITNVPVGKYNITAHLVSYQSVALRSVDIAKSAGFTFKLH